MLGAASSSAAARALALALGLSSATPAIFLASSGAVPVAAASDAESDPQALLAEARRLVATADPESVRQVVDRILAAARARGDSALEVDAREILAEDFLRTGFVERARRESELALEMAQRAGDRGRELRALGGVARADATIGRTRTALATLREVLAGARARGDLDLQARTLHDIGQCHLNGGAPDSAAAAFEAGLALIRERPLQALEASLLQDLGSTYSQRGQPERARDVQERALTFARRHGLRRAELGSLARLATLDTDTERYSEALARQSEALPLARALGFRRAVANLLVSQGAVHLALGRPADALAAFEEALGIVHELRFERFEAAVLLRVGRAHAARGELDAAARALEAARALFERLGSPLAMTTALHDLGLTSLRRGDAASATAELERALAILEENRRAGRAADVLCHLGEAALAAGDTLRARQRLDATRARAGRHALDVRREVLSLEARLLQLRGDLAGADARLAGALAIADSVRSRLAGDEVRVGFHQGVRDLYPARAAVLCELAARGSQAARAEAFHVAERAHARALLDALSGVRIDPGGAAPAALRDRERGLAQRLQALQTELARDGGDGAQPARLDSLQRELLRAAREHRQVGEAIAAHSPAYGDLLGYRNPLDADAVRARVLAPDQVLLEYLVGDTESFVFLVGREPLAVARIPCGADSLAAWVGALRAASCARPETLAGAATALYDLLVRPVAAGIPAGARILVVPDGALHHLPFALLHDGARWLVEEHAVSVAPSASVLDPELRRPARRRGRRLLAVGNPTTFHAGALVDERRAASGGRLGELPYSEEEVRRVARRFRRARVFVREAATEEAVKRHLRSATDVHFATHALVNPEEPRLGGLVLAQDEDPSEDGFFQVHEILRQEIDADLVVLSACNTGLGTLAGGEGVLGLQRAFLAAGAASLLITLWEVSDRAAVDLLDRFHAERFGAAAPTADRALQAAQCSLLARGAPPRDWGALVLAGRAGVVTPERAPGVALQLVAAGLALAAVAGLLGAALGHRRRPRPAR